MQFKDLVGLSKPLTRLIEVVSQGIGAVSRPYLIRKNADANAYAVKKISEALKNVADEQHLPVVFQKDGIEIWQKPEDQTLRLEMTPLEERIENRIDFQERKRQENLENISSIAAAELADEETVAAESPDEDWVSRFFSHAQDVTSEQMQELWGRILAGEVKRPGSYSLRTLDFVRNLTKAEAATFEKLAKLSISVGGTSGVPIAEAKWLEDERQVIQADHFKLAELGVMYPTSLAIRMFTGENSAGLLVSGNLILLLEKLPPVVEYHLQIWKFTDVGSEILQLIPVEGDREHLTKLATHLAGQKINSSIAEIVERLPDGRYRYKNAVEVKPEAEA